MTEAHAIVEVELDPATAFDVFTREIAAWWRADRGLWGPGGELSIEPGVGGRLTEGGREVGTVSVWERGPRLAFSYGPPDGVPGDRTEVEVRFEATEHGTRVVLRHGGWTVPEPQGYWSSQLAGFAKHSLEHVLLARIGEFLDAIGAGDMEFFERNLTDDALLIFPGHVYTKATGIDAMRDHPPYVKYDLADPRIVHLEDSTAVITYHVTVMHTENVAPQSTVVTTVLAKQGDTWRMALTQWTPAD
jgi:hypothetical protein